MTFRQLFVRLGLLAILSLGCATKQDVDFREKQSREEGKLYLPVELSKDHLSVISKNLTVARLCYEKLLLKNPEAEGEVRTAILIGSSGVVDRVKIVQSTLQAQNFETCLENKIREWEFAPPEKGRPVKINYPFVFKAL